MDVSSNACSNPSSKLSERMLRALCDFGLNSYKHLLAQEELSVISTIMHCSVDGMCLLYSMFLNEFLYYLDISAKQGSFSNQTAV